MKRYNQLEFARRRSDLDDPASGTPGRHSVRLCVRLRAVVGMVAWVTLSALMAGCAATAVQDYEGHRTLEFARELARDHRYREACSLVELEVARHGDERTAFQALLLLAELREERGDSDGARVALERAQALASPDTSAASVIAPVQIDAAQPLPRPPEWTAGSGESTPIDPGGDGLPSDASPQGSPDSRVTNTFFDTDLRQVLSDLSFESGVPILWDATVQGLVTYEAVDKPLDMALKAIVVPLGYSYAYSDGAYWVGSAKPDSPAFATLSRTRVKSLANLDAEQALALLNDGFRPYVKASSAGNLVCITAPAVLADRIEADLEAIDSPRDLVVIEVIMAEISETAMREIGFDWFTRGPSGQGDWSLATNLTRDATDGLVATVEQTGFAAIDWTTRLEALVLAGKAEIRASPRITTLNGRPAGISLTRDQYFVIQTGTGVGYQYNTLESVSSGIKLSITPYVSDDGMVTVYLKPEVGDVTGESPTSELPEISWRRAETVIRVRDGETFSIGGLNLEQQKTIQRKLPLLGDLPLLGALFRHESRESKRSEVVVFVTPRVLAR